MQGAPVALPVVDGLLHGAMLSRRKREGERAAHRGGGPWHPTRKKTRQAEAERVEEVALG